MAVSATLSRKFWRTSDGRKIHIHLLSLEHIRNIHAKSLRSGVQMPRIIRDEIKRRGYTPQDLEGPEKTVNHLTEPTV